jgi:Tol biopolymer transport system component
MINKRMVVGVIAVILASFGIVRLIRLTNPTPEPVILPRCPHVEVLTSTTADDLDPRWSPDGTSIAFVGHHEGNPEVYLLDVATRALTNLSRSRYDDYQPMWSPDGRYLAYFHRQVPRSKEAIQLRIIEIATRHIRAVTRDYRSIAPWNVRWSADSSQLRFWAHPGWYSYDLISQVLRREDEDNTSPNYPWYDPRMPVMSSDGRGASVKTSNRDYGLPNTLLLSDETSGKTYPILQLNIGFAVDSWSPTRDQIAFYSYAGVYVIDLPTGNYRDFIQGVGKIMTVDWSPDGNYLASLVTAPTNARKVVIADIRSGAACVFGRDYRWLRYIRRPTVYSYIYSDPQWSPNGDQVVFSSGYRDTSNLTLITMPD